MESRERTEAYKLPVGPELPRAAGSGKVHWTIHPLRILLAVLAAGFLLYAIKFAILLPANGPVYLSLSPRIQIFIMIAANVICLTSILLLGALFYWLVRRTQSRQDPCFTACFKTGGALWIGIVLLVCYAIFFYIISKDMLWFSVSATFTFIHTIEECLIQILLIYLAYPVLQRRFGIVRGALLLCAAFSALSMIQTLLNQIFSAAIVDMENQDIISNYFPKYLLSAAAVTFSQYMLGIGMYLLTGRRLPGTWALASGISGLVALLFFTIRPTLSALINEMVWLDELEQVIFYLPVMALNLGLLACMQHWKTRQAFMVSLKAFSNMLKGIQEID